MCECGCTMNNEAFRLPGGKGFFYLIELYAGCDNCVAAPGILVRRITPETWDYEEAKEAPLLPLHTFDGMTECPIKCGLDPDEFRKAVVPVIDGYPVDRKGRKLDGEDAYEIGSQVWDEAVHRRPEVLTPKPAAV